MDITTDITTDITKNITMTTLFERLGGEAAIEAAVNGLYQRILSDPELAPFFARTNIDALARRQRTFVAAAVGGPDEYRGRDMATAHRRFAIEDRHFDRVAQHLIDTLESLGVPEAEIDGLLAVVATLRDQIVNTPSRSSNRDG